MDMNTPNRERSVCNERWTFMVSGEASVLASPNRDQSVSTGKDSRNTTGAPGRGGPWVQLWCLLFFTKTCQGIWNGTDDPWTGTGCTKNAGVGHPSRVLPSHCSTVTSYHLHHGHDMGSSPLTGYCKVTCKQCGVDVVCQCCVRLLRKVRLSDEAMPRVFVREGRKLGNGISGEARMSNCVMVCQAPAGFGEFGRYDVIRYVRRRSALQSAQVGTHKWTSADRCDDIG